MASVVASVAVLIVTASPTSPILMSKDSAITALHSVPISPKSSSSSAPGLTLLPDGSKTRSPVVIISPPASKVKVVEFVVRVPSKLSKLLDAIVMSVPSPEMFSPASPNWIDLPEANQASSVKNRPKSQAVPA